jgi:tetratricopeptide (TPR) repeat protein
MNARGIAIVALAGALFATGPAYADRSMRDARAHFKRAEAALAEGRFQEALTSYQAAYEAQPLPGLLFNIAQCYSQLQMPEQAIFFFERYLTLAPDSPNRERTMALITTQRERLQAAAKPATPPPPPSAPVAEAPATPPTAPEAAPAESPPAAAAGPKAALDRIAEVLKARPAPDAEEPPAFVAENRRRRAAEEAQNRPIYTRWWFWTGAAVVLAAAGASAVMLVQKEPPPAPQGPLGVIDRR